MTVRDGERVAALERLLGEVEAIPDVAARESALAAVQALVELYGAGLERIVSLLAERADAAELADRLAVDELVSHLLILHDLHPVPVEERVRGALAEVRPYLDSHGGDVELVAVEDGVVRLRMEGSCEGCPSSTATLKLAIEDAVRKAAPEVEAIEADGVAAPPLLQLEVIRPTWSAVPAPALRDGESALVDVDGEPVLFARVEQALYAYRPGCAVCGESLASGALEGPWLECTCATRYDLTRAGRSADGASLEPIPLLEERGGSVKVALGAPA